MAPSRPILVVPDNAMGELKPQPMRISIYDLRRDGPYLVLDFGITCLDGASTPCVMGNTFTPDRAANTDQALTSDRVDTMTPSGVELIDPASQQEYLVVRDAQDRPFTSALPSIDDARTYRNWVVFPAPPASVTALDVAFPDGGPQVPSVPISSGPAPATGLTAVAATPSPFAQPLGSTDTTGLTLPVKNLVQTVGNPTGSDAESANQATITLRSDVLFHFAKSNLTARARAILSGVAAQVKARAVGTVLVTGYTDSIGSNAVNIPLSVARARSVVSALKPATPGIAYVSAGKGSADPVAPNTQADGSDNPAGRALNRRVTIAFAVKARAAPTPPPAANAGAAPASGPASTTFTVGAGGTRDKYAVTNRSLFREGSLLVLRMTLDCVQTAMDACGTEQDLLGTDTIPPLPPVGVNFALNTYFTVSGFYLVQPGTGTEYIPLHDPTGAPATGNISEVVPAGQSYQFWLYFPAPPASVSTMTLVTPGSRARIGLPIASSPPPQ